MAGTKHTAGWKVYDGPQISPIFSGIVCMISASDRLVAVITEDETPVDPSTWSDIARLIAAAPDLLAALKEAEADLSLAAGIAIGYDLAPVLATIRAARSKAEGSSHD